MLLSGRMVLDWSHEPAGAFCARILGDMGAEVIKIEPPGAGDPMRRAGPIAPASDYGQSPLFGYLNHGKRSVTLDPTTPTGAALLLALAERADVLVETEASKLGRTGSALLERLRAANEKLVVVSIAPYGADAVDAPPSTPLTLQHAAGYAFHEAAPVTDPASQPPVGCTDLEGPLATGVAAAVATMWGLLAREGGDAAPHVDLAEFDLYATQLYPGPLSEWSEGRRTFSRNRAAFQGTEVAGGLIWIAECADGWVIVSPREQHQWDRWMTLLGNPDWASDAALCGDRAVRKTNFRRLQDLMSEETRKMTRQQLFDGARREHVACLPVNRPSDILELRQLLDRQFFDELRLASGRSIRIPGLPFRLESGNMALARGRTVHSPKLGEANEAVLGERLGVAELGALVNQGVV